MSVQPFSDLLSARTQKIFDEADLRYFIERFFKSKLKATNIRCVSATREKVCISDKSATVRQMIYLLDWDMRQELDNELGFTFKELKVTQW